MGFQLLVTSTNLNRWVDPGCLHHASHYFPGAKLAVKSSGDIADEIAAVRSAFKTLGRWERLHVRGELSLVQFVGGFGCKVWRSAVFSWWKCGWRWWYFEDDLFFQRFTPPKFNSGTWKWWVSKFGISEFPGTSFQVNHVKFQVCNCWVFLGGSLF